MPFERATDGMMRGTVGTMCILSCCPTLPASIVAEEFGDDLDQLKSSKRGARRGARRGIGSQENQVEKLVQSLGYGLVSLRRQVNFRYLYISTQLTLHGDVYDGVVGQSHLTRFRTIAVRHLKPWKM